ncbi:50S ribosomal protein L24 [Candidatus Woesearchaeota archaeon]|nr:50S ribosomal protein L24 [Candidatus Woesearchaeota archaeon]
MKLWSRKWVGSKNPRKQRKYRYNAPLHIIRKFMSVRLSKDLKQKYGKRNLPVRKGDLVKVIVGEFKGRVAKVTRVSLVNHSVYVEGVVNVKRDGTKLTRPIDPSNLLITELNMEDKYRKKILERK